MRQYSTTTRFVNTNVSSIVVVYHYVNIILNFFFLPNVYKSHEKIKNSCLVDISWSIKTLLGELCSLLI